MNHKFARLLLQFLKEVPTYVFSSKIKSLQKPREWKLIKVEAPFIDEISGIVIIKILDKTTHSTMMLKLKFMQNLAMLDITTNGLDTIILDQMKC